MKENLVLIHNSSRFLLSIFKDLNLYWHYNFHNFSINSNISGVLPHVIGKERKITLNALKGLVICFFNGYQSNKFLSGFFLVAVFHPNLPF